jgi:gas vesicle protein
MMGRARVAVKFLVYGLLLGVLFAPRSGEETREMLMQRIKETIDEITGGNSKQSSEMD